MKKHINKIVLCLGIVFVLFSIRYMSETDKQIKGWEFQEKNGKNEFTTTAKLLGVKKAAADILWIKQGLDVGGQMGNHEDVEKVTDIPTMIKNTSESISYLDPYNRPNYYFSGVTVALIRIFNRYDYGIEILSRGMRYNPDDPVMKYYLGGVAADRKGDSEEVIRLFEEVIKQQPDEMLMDRIAYIYEMRYKKSKLESDLIKAAAYWEKLIEAKDDNYRKRAEKNLVEHEKELKDIAEKIKR